MSTTRCAAAALMALAMIGCWASRASGTELDSSNLRVVFTTSPNPFGFQIINTATNATVLSSSSTSFNSVAVTGASVSGSGINSSGNNYVNLNFTLPGNGVATGTFTLVSATQLQVSLTGTSVTEPAGTEGSPYASPTIGQTFANQGSESYYGAFSPVYSSNGLQNNSATAGTTNTQADNGTFLRPTATVTTADANSEGVRAPFYFTSNNVGVYTATQNTGTYTFGSGTSGKTGFTFNTTDGTTKTVTPTLSYNIMVGSSPANVLQQFKNVAGGAFMPPTSAFDPYFWRDDNHNINTSQSGATNAQQEVMDDATKLQTLKIAATGIQIDRPYGSNDANQNGDVSGWGDMNFDSTSNGFVDANGVADAKAMISTLKSMGINTYVWIANRANQKLLTTANANTNYLLPLNKTDPAVTTVSSPAYNMLNASAYSSFQTQLQQFVKDGVAGFKIDRGGEGEMPVAMQNEIPTLFDGLAQQTGSNLFVVARDANDQARQSAVTYAGDSQCSFVGLSTTVQEGLRAGLIGFPFWGSDTGGYTGNPSEDLFARWMEFSAYCPLMEVLQGAGTSGLNNNRDVWYDYAVPGTASTASPLVSILQAQTALHHDLIPYVQSSLAESLQDGMPIMRAMFLEFPSDPTVTNMTSEYMYGHNILVAPVTTAATAVTANTSNEAISTSGQSVYLPLGTRWVEYNQALITGANGFQTIQTSAQLTAIAGGTTLSLTVPEGNIPTYAREGAIIPRGDIVQDDLTTATLDPTWKPSLHIDVFPSDQLRSTFNYDTAAGNLVGIEAFISGSVVQIDFQDLGVGGNLNVYMGRFFGFRGLGTVSVNGSVLASNGYTYDSADELLTVPFSGATTLDVNFTPVPEPAMTAIAAMAVLAGTWRPRRSHCRCRR